MNKQNGYGQSKTWTQNMFVEGHLSFFFQD